MCRRVGWRAAGRTQPSKDSFWKGSQFGEGPMFLWWREVAPCALQLFDASWWWVVALQGEVLLGWLSGHTSRSSG